MNPFKLLSAFPLLLVSLTGCSGAAGDAVVDSLERLEPGIWRAVLASPGGELPFQLRVSRSDDGFEAAALNGVEQVSFSSVQARQGSIVFRNDGYDSEIDARLSADGLSLVGTWRKKSAQGYSQLGFQAVHGLDHRFEPEPGAEGEFPPSVDGDWRVTFVDQDGEMPSRGEFVQQGSHVTGTFLTELGDYRFLEGDYSNGRLRLSCFDGAHAFLFRAGVQQDGTLKGDFWSRDSYHATWTAERLSKDESDSLPDPYLEVALNNGRQSFNFSFPDLDGNLVAHDDPRFRNKVVLVNIFGSWCPNCNDEAPLLAGWYRQHRDRGLEVVGLAYELTGDAQRDGRFVRKFAQRYGVEYPLLLAGTSNKTVAAGTVPDLSRIRAYPTTIFIGRDGKVRRIHSGFAGPATGQHHERLVEEFETLIEKLLSE